MFGRGAGRDGGLGAGAGCCFWGRRFAAGAILASAATAPNAAMLISATTIHPNWNRLLISLYNLSLCNSPARLFSVPAPAWRDRVGPPYICWSLSSAESAVTSTGGGSSFNGSKFASVS